MTKKKYLRNLRRALHGVPERERERLVDYYAEIIDDAYERGKTSREVFRDLESPEVAAENYLRDSRDIYEDDYVRAERVSRSDIPPRREDDNLPREKSGGSDLLLVLRILLIFIVLPLSIAAFGVLLAFAVSGFALAVSGLAGIGISFGPMFGGHVVVGLAQIGACIVLIGVGILLMATAPLLVRLCGALWRFVCNMKKKARKKRKAYFRTIATGISTVLVGGMIFVAFFGVLGFKVNALAVTEAITECTQVLEGENLRFSADNLSIKTEYWDGEQAKLVYSGAEDFARKFTVEDGVYSLKEEEHYSIGWLKQSWKRGIFFQAVVRNYYNATLYLPESYSGNLELTVVNGGIELEGITFTQISAKVTNGAVTMRNVSAQSVYAETTNGAIILNECVSEVLICQTGNGTITFKNLQARDIMLTTQVGSISGTIFGQAEDYKIQSHAQVGHSNLIDRFEGNGSLTVTVNVGSIEVKFSKKEE